MTNENEHTHDERGAAAWFVDGAYLGKVTGRWVGDGKGLDYTKLRRLLEEDYLTDGERISDAYYFNADPDPPSAGQSRFHTSLRYPPPGGPGLRVKMYWLQSKELRWPQRMGGETVVHPATGEPFVQTQQKAVDVGLAFHMMKSFTRRRWTKLFLAAGDGDFHEVVQHFVEDEGVDLYLIGKMDSMSTELLPYGTLIDLDAVVDRVSRPRAMTPHRNGGPQTSTELASADTDAT